MKIIRNSFAFLIIIEAMFGSSERVYFARSARWPWAGKFDLQMRSRAALLACRGKRRAKLCNVRQEMEILCDASCTLTSIDLESKYFQLLEKSNLFQELFATYKGYSAFDMTFLGLPSQFSANINELGSWGHCDTYKCIYLCYI